MKDNREFFEDVLRNDTNDKMISFVCNDYDASYIYTAVYGTNWNERQHGFLGFGGAKQQFKLEDGTIIRSNNVWCRGDAKAVPADILKKFPVAYRMMVDY